MFENLRALTEEDIKMGDYSPLKAGQYIFLVKDVEVKNVPRKEWTPDGKIIETTDMEDQLRIKTQVFKLNGSNEIENLEGTVQVNPSYTVFIVNSDMGWYKKDGRPKTGRAVLAALFGLTDPKKEIPLKDPADLIDKTFQAYCTIKKSKSGKSRNELIDVLPYEEAIPGYNVENVEGKKNIEVTPFD